MSPVYRSALYRGIENFLITFVSTLALTLTGVLAYFQGALTTCVPTTVAAPAGAVAAPCGFRWEVVGFAFALAICTALIKAFAQTVEGIHNQSMGAATVAVASLDKNATVVSAPAAAVVETSAPPIDQRRR